MGETQEASGEKKPQEEDSKPGKVVIFIKYKNGFSSAKIETQRSWENQMCMFESN